MIKKPATAGFFYFKGGLQHFVNHSLNLLERRLNFDCDAECDSLHTGGDQEHTLCDERGLWVNCSSCSSRLNRLRRFTGVTWRGRARAPHAVKERGELRYGSTNWLPQIRGGKTTVHPRRARRGRVVSSTCSGAASQSTPYGSRKHGQA